MAGEGARQGHSLTLTSGQRRSVRFCQVGGAGLSEKANGLLPSSTAIDCPLR